MDVNRASRTAVLVCQGRAVADGRIAEGRFADPTAMALLRDGERIPVRSVREGVPPKGWTARLEFEMVRAAGDVIVPRTVAIDDAVKDRLARQMVIVGAGLDGRAWRMPELAGVQVSRSTIPRHSAASAIGRCRSGRRGQPCGSCRSTSPATGSTRRWRRQATHPANPPRGSGKVW